MAISKLQSARILVTGASGFIGTHLIEQLEMSKAEIFQGSRTHQPNLKNSIQINYQNLQELTLILSDIQPTFIIHLANSNMKLLKEFELESASKLDFKMHSNLFAAVKTMKYPSKIIFIGSCDEYGMPNEKMTENTECNPVNQYGKAKFQASKLLLKEIKNGFLSGVILRPSVVYGPNQSPGMLIPSVIDKLVNKKTFKVLNGDQLRDFIHVEDLANAVTKLLMKSDFASIPVLNISKGESIPVREVVNLIVENIGSQYQNLIEFKTSNLSPRETNYYQVENSLARTILNWNPKISLNEGVRHLISGKNFMYSKDDKK